MHTQLEHFDHRAWTGAAEAMARLRSQRLAIPGLRLWSGLLAATVALALLLAFHQVVLGGVQRAEVRHQAHAVLVDAIWRCQALRGAEPARICMQGLSGLSSEILPVELDPPVAVRPAVLPRLALLSDGARTR